MRQTDGKDLTYPNSDLFLYGDVAGSKYTKVDLSVWDMATNCGSCHVGGGLVEKDRAGLRLSQRALADNSITPFLNTVYESWDPKTGAPASSVTRAPWAYPATTDNKAPALGGANAMLAPNGWGSVAMNEGGTANGAPYIQNGQLMMPNVREMDCLFCHFQGYNNLMSSVFAQMGILNAAPMAGAGLMDMMPGSPTQGGYNAAMVDLGPKDGNGMQTVSLKQSVVDNIKRLPPSANCQQCHSPNTLKNLPEMMAGFLSSAPMILNSNPNNPMVGPTGLVMPAYDMNAPWVDPAATSPLIDATNLYSYMSLGMLQAQGGTIYNRGLINGMTTFGGSNKGGTGPMYYEALVADLGLSPDFPEQQDQNSLKKSTVPFPRADWFKRGDAWQAGQDIHGSIGCAGCHMDTNSTNPDKNQCDPGRGFDGSGTIEDGSQIGTKVDTRNTVKRCESCHVSGTNPDGNAVNNYNAPDPTVAHQKAGLTAMITKAMGPDGSGGQKLIPGNHMDVLDCTVCHVKKVSMAVRALDCTSGNRYPTMVGFDYSKGMMGMFEDPAPEDNNIAARAMYNGMNQTINDRCGYTSTDGPGTICAVTQQPGPGYQAEIPSGHVIGGALQEWFPLRTWSKVGNGLKTSPNFRRKIYLTNTIVSALFNNDANTSVDANGDGVNGQVLTVGNANSTQGFGEPIFDPWIQRDLKAGMNFAPGGFAPIPVGFGSGAYRSAYDLYGKFTGAWKYVGVYGGNAIFTTPDEIREYKNYRTSIKDQPGQSGKSWDGTRLDYIGGLYQVTHGVKPVSQQAIGRPKAYDASGKVIVYGCSDCHAGSKEFFDGGFNMTGTAIPADAQWTPAPGIIDPSPSTMMQRPAVFIPTIKAYKGDLRTGTELFNKLGQPRSVAFEEEVEEAGVMYTKTTDLDRGKVLYPDADGYFKADGTAPGGTGANGSFTRDQWLSYLLGIGDNVAAYGIGADPIAQFSATFPDADPNTAGNQLLVNTPYTLAADTSVNSNGSFTYSLSIIDGTTVNAPSLSKTFTATGTYAVTLKVTDEEGKTATATKSIYVVNPPSTGMTIGPTTAIRNVASTFTFGNLKDHDSLKIYWADGTSTTLANVGAAGSSAQAAHTYTTTGTKKLTVLVYKNGVQVDSKYNYATVGL
ncbi:PKD domain-containing protein [Geotalea sp. SG265]|uniref:PKD domain-containing protein n=1 Tax=Geotalea sp. SG265 TaxID=2922867 RepID=UPI001FAF5EB9|nr:PKD domain-containing protein [Geotalea sp. SG265]